ncbi:hypothetical protein Tco_1285469 [Tanacetum coccineum]
MNWMDSLSKKGRKNAQIDEDSLVFRWIHRLPGGMKHNKNLDAEITTEVQKVDEIALKTSKLQSEGVQPKQKIKKNGRGIPIRSFQRLMQQAKLMQY